jgi:hypothetical protein
LVPECLGRRLGLAKVIGDLAYLADRYTRVAQSEAQIDRLLRRNLPERVILAGRVVPRSM